jgi:hypothetical protein
MVQEGCSHLDKLQCLHGTHGASGFRGIDLRTNDLVLRSLLSCETFACFIPIELLELPNSDLELVYVADMVGSFACPEEDLQGTIKCARASP